jgi:hypothetical protein
VSLKRELSDLNSEGKQRESAEDRATRFYEQVQKGFENFSDDITNLKKSLIWNYNPEKGY